MWILKLVLALAGCYALIVGAAYFLQTALIFPAGMVGGGSGLPPGGRHVTLETGDGERVVLVRIPPRKRAPGPLPLLLAFAGNAWNADTAGDLLHTIFPEYQIAVLHYRGYGPSSGRPSAEALISDAGLAYDHLAAEAANGIVAIGFSIGTAVTIELGAKRKLSGAVLVTPLDSLKELAATHYPWLPVRWLLRHRLEPAATLRGLDLPVAIITAGQDTVIPAARSAPVREAAKDLRADITIQGAGHNTIYERHACASALREGLVAVLGE